MDYSKNERAENLFGKRPSGVSMFDQPCELGYHCPICKYKLVVKGEYDERLHWSEYECFLWCSVCDLDIPSCLCVLMKTRADVEQAIKVFLDSADVAKKKAGTG